MNGPMWILVGAAVVLPATLLVLARRRRRIRAIGADETMRRARQAIRESGHQQHRQRRGSLRGKGYGGNEGQASDAGVTSDSGGMP
ncbi:hypothetical protein ACQP0U_10420 [Micromonospora sp. CA-269861]|uniref:hypothetical protein n=1 Tax=Micromonospora sp. CA-269861 TaxID=3239968 RepID=UPI003D8DB072